MKTVRKVFHHTGASTSCPTASPNQPFRHKAPNGTTKRLPLDLLSHCHFVHNAIFMKIPQSKLNLHFKVALYSYGEDIKSHLPSNK